MCACECVGVCRRGEGGGGFTRNALNQEKQNTNLAAHSPGGKSQMFASEKQLECTEIQAVEPLVSADRSIAYTLPKSPQIFDLSVP